MGLSRQGDIYFNIHTKQQNFYGDIRGQLQPVPDDVLTAAGISRLPADSE